jgi:hypothetical protein
LLCEKGKHHHPSRKIEGQMFLLKKSPIKCICHIIIVDDFSRKMIRARKRIGRSRVRDWSFGWFDWANCKLRFRVKDKGNYKIRSAWLFSSEERF